MKKLFLASVMILMALALNGCGGGSSSPPPTFLASIISDPASDGDILKDSITNAYTVTQGMTTGVQSVFAGINPATQSETRAFLRFPLGGVNGVPSNALIVSAFLDIVIDSIQLQTANDTIPIRIDLVNFQPPTLIGTDFELNSLPALATVFITPPISQSDLGLHVATDVTVLMREAQRLGLPDFQVRIMEDLGPVTPGLIEINNTTGPNRALLAPLLEVVYQ